MTRSMDWLNGRASLTTTRTETGRVEGLYSLA